MIPDEVRAAVARAEAILLDTNLLLPWILARAFGPAAVRGFPRADAFDAAAIGRLDELVNIARRSVTTPHVLAETSSLLGGYRGDSERARKALLNETRLFDERWPRLDDARHSLHDRRMAWVFPTLGMTDWALLTLARLGVLVVSTDLRLCEAIERMSGLVLRFNYIRE